MQISTDGATALLDAVGMSANQIRITNETKIINDEMSVVMVILTMEWKMQEYIPSNCSDYCCFRGNRKMDLFTLGADIDARHFQMLNIRSENVISFNKSDMNGMLNDISYGIRDYTVNNSMGKMKKDFLDFIDKKDRRN
jgi:hypothetical protein